MSSHASPTLYPPPPVDFASAPIEHPLLVTRAPAEGQDVFTNAYPLWKPPPGLALFGGILIGQAIQAAQQTTPPAFLIYHMTCTFRAPPDTSKPLFYRVTRSGDGRSFASREVKAEQGGTVFFSAECNFSLTRTANPVLHQIKMPQVEKQSMDPPPAPEISETNEIAFTEQMVLPGFLRFAGPTTSRRDVDPFVWLDYPPTPNVETSSPTNFLHSWARSRGNMSDSRTGHLAVLGCLTDSWFLSCFPDINPEAAGANGKDIGFMISLNHTIWFHSPHVRLDNWLLVKKGSSWAAEGRCLVEQQIWAKDRTLVATCVQEGVLRLKKPRAEKEKMRKLNASKM